MRDALIGLASALVIPFVIITIASSVLGRWLLLSNTGMFVASAVFIGVAVCAVGKTVHSFYQFNWSGEPTADQKPSSVAE